MLQVSWIKDVKKATTGDNSVALYDTEGYANMRRAREKGEVSTAAPIVTIVVNYPGSYSKFFLIRFILK